VPKRQTAFTCGQCGHRESRWLGRCPECGAWDSLVEEALPTRAGGRSRPGVRKATRTSGDGGGRASAAVALSDVVSSSEARYTSGIDELDRVLGGGIVPGSVVLVGGEPGIGKSTLLLQVLDRVGRDRPVLLVCGEESAAQIRMRAERVCESPGAIRVLAETEVDAVLGALESERPELLVIDSVQTLYSDALSSAPGTVSQVREATGLFMRFAKETGTAVFLVGHVTKDGAIAGPRVLEHMVDTVLQFEGDRNRFFRVLRAVKNRFGSTNEMGVFEMGKGGLVGVGDPSRLFLPEREPGIGAAINVAVEGSRCYLVEVQALVNKTELALPRRVATGFDRNRLAMIIAVLQRHAGLSLSSCDIFANIAGGIRVEEPAADLAVALAIASAERNIPLPPQTAVFGEISLTGEVRSSSQPERRSAEAAKLGFATVVTGSGDARRIGKSVPSVTGVADIRGAVAHVLGKASRRPAVTAGESDDGGV
jgi:DNA repair protein RadA/Sms